MKLVLYKRKTLNLDLELRNNDTNNLHCHVLDHYDALLDLTGATIYFIVNNKVTLDSGESVLLSKEVSSLPNTSWGNALIILTPTDTLTLIGNYIYTIRLELATGETYTLVEGTVCFKRTLPIES